MNLAALAAALRMAADALDATTPQAEGPSWYSRQSPPPDAPSWRAALARAHREGVATTRSGRQTLIDRADWDRLLETRAARRGAVEVTEADARALAAMGIAVPATELTVTSERMAERRSTAADEIRVRRGRR